jgi:hypothetical protein
MLCIATPALGIGRVLGEDALMRMILSAVLVAIVSSLLLPIPATASDPHLQTDAASDFLPEGLAWDGARRRFLLSSVRLQRIVAVDPKTGKTRLFVQSDASLLGLHIAPDGASVWSTFAAFAADGRHTTATGVVGFALKDGKSLGRFDLPQAGDTSVLGDLLFLDPHTLIASDSVGGGIHTFDLKTHAYKTVLAGGILKSPQGIAAAGVPGTVIIADYPTGLWQLNPSTGEHRQLAVQTSIELRGIDGLYRDGNRLVAVQNGTQKHRVLLIDLDAHEAVANVRRLAEARADWDEPALGVIRGERFWFVANGQWDRFGDGFSVPADFPLRAPLLDSVALP